MEKKLDSTLVFDGKLLKVHKDNIIAENGNKAIREYITHPGGVCILAFVDGKVIMEKQFRYPYQKEILELPAGKLEVGEDPLLAAKREFEEETGYKADSIVSLGYVYPSVGYTDEVLHLYYADKISKGTKHLDFDESLKIVTMGLDEVIDKIKNNEINDCKTICLIYKYLNLIGR